MNFALAFAFLLAAALFAFGAFRRSEKIQGTGSAPLLSFAENCVRTRDSNYDVGALVLEASKVRKENGWNLKMRIFCGVVSAGWFLMAVVLFAR